MYVRRARYAYRSEVAPPHSESSLYIDALYYRTVLNLEKGVVSVVGGLQFLFTNTHLATGTFRNCLLTYPLKI